MIFRDREGREVGDLVGGRAGRGGERDKERENKTESRDAGEAVRRREREERKKRRRAVCRVGGREERWFGREKEGSEGEKGRATSARSRATIGDHLPSWPALVLDLSGGGSEGEKSTTSRFAAAAAAAIIKLFTHTERYLSSKQRDHNVLLFDPHFVSDLSLTATAGTICTRQILLVRSGVLLTISRGSASVWVKRIAPDNVTWTSRAVISNRVGMR